VEPDQKQQYRLENRQKEGAKPPASPESQETEEVVPGVPIVRSNTPRPLSFGSLISHSGQLQEGQEEPVPLFPAKAPSAPPLPEELGEREDERAGEPVSATPVASQNKPAEDAQEFIWLFEYGLEMDATILNSSERLDGLALLYGPAVLKGYQLMLGAQRIHGSNGPTIAAIVPVSRPEAEVWGVLYRIPRRLAERNGEDPSLLDTIHAAITPQKFFKGVEVVVHETYRDREISSLTYVATDIAYQHLHLVSAHQWREDNLFLQRLAEIARKQKLPESYVEQYEVQDDQETQALQPFLPITNPGMRTPDSQRVEQNTEPLPAVTEGGLPSNSGSQKEPRAARWLVIFAVYLVALLFIVLLFAVLQGMGVGSAVLTTSFAPLGVPWLVIMYGLLGGCISCIVTLGHFRLNNPPLFIMITWFTRPYIGAVLAIFAYLVLTSGLFIFGENVGRHVTFFWLIGALAGLCEGWIFFRRRPF